MIRPLIFRFLNVSVLLVTLVALPDSTLAVPCDDGNACNGLETGDTTTGCQPGTPLDCNDGNICTDDICDPLLGCLHASNSILCNDGNACTIGDSCNGSVCVGGNQAADCTSCQAVAEIPARGGTFVGTTNAPGSLKASCANNLARPERVYRWTPSSSGQATIKTCSPNTTFDTVVYLRADSCENGTEIACNDNAFGCGVTTSSPGQQNQGSFINPMVTAGQTYFIVVDGYDGQLHANQGTFHLTVIAPNTCGNNVREGLEACDGADNVACPSTICSAACECVPPENGLPDLLPAIRDISLDYGATVSIGDVTEGCAESTSGIDLLRFGVRSINDGSADFYVGPPFCPSPCTEHPLEVCGNPYFICSPAEGHNHAHYDNYARYELLDGSGQSVVVGHKQGFCLLDIFCQNQQSQQKYTCDDQGITAGCRDEYSANLGCQYLDITGVPPGNYILRVTVDPFFRIPELDETNNVTEAPIIIPQPGTPLSTPTPTASPTATATGLATPTPTGAGCSLSTLTIPAGGGVFTGSTNGVSALSGSCGSTGTSPETVFQWTPNQSGTATIETCSATGTTFDTVLYLRQGSCASGAVLSCKDDAPDCPTTFHSSRASRFTSAVSAGTTYYIVVDGYGGASGNFILTVIAPGAPSPTPSSTPTNTLPAVPTATATPTSTPTAVAAETSTPTATPSSDDATATATNTPTAVAAETSTPTATPSSDGATATATNTPTAAPAGSCGNPIPIPPEGGAVTGTTGGTGTLSGSCGTSSGSPEKLFQWTAPRSGTTTIETCSATVTNFDTVLYVRQGSCSTGPEIACRDDHQNCPTTFHPRRASRITTAVTAGQTYFIVVDGFGGAAGNFSLNVIPPP